ncbi:MAG TPA: hypothetical protein VMM76_07675 [Pirellulaceae bacterium]|nr:hypothetical protein [Pirellulaceae bacterium]
MNQRLGGIGAGADRLGYSRVAEALDVTQLDRSSLTWDESVDTASH